MTKSRSGLVTSTNAEVSTSPALTSLIYQAANREVSQFPHAQTGQSRAPNPQLIVKYVQGWGVASKGPYWTYLSVSGNHNALYTGSTESLTRRMHEHKRKNKFGFSHKYNADKLVYVEAYATRQLAEEREFQLKKWDRSWKIALVESFNPAWHDLSSRLLSEQVEA